MSSLDSILTVFGAVILTAVFIAAIVAGALYGVKPGLFIGVIGLILLAGVEGLNRMIEQRTDSDTVSGQPPRADRPAESPPKPSEVQTSLKPPVSQNEPAHFLNGSENSQKSFYL